jgi:hypothetical protein
MSTTLRALVLAIAVAGTAARPPRVLESRGVAGRAARALAGHTSAGPADHNDPECGDYTSAECDAETHCTLNLVLRTMKCIPKFSDEPDYDGGLPRWQKIKSVCGDYQAECVDCDQTTGECTRADGVPLSSVPDSSDDAPGDPAGDYDYAAASADDYDYDAGRPTCAEVDSEDGCPDYFTCERGVCTALSTDAAAAAAAAKTKAGPALAPAGAAAAVAAAAAPAPGKAGVAAAAPAPAPSPPSGGSAARAAGAAAGAALAAAALLW